MPLNMKPSNPHGCDEWLGSRYCGASAPHVDEVTDETFCEAHAGPLAWSDRDINLVSLAVRVAGELDVQYVPPARLLDISERAA